MRIWHRVALGLALLVGLSGAAVDSPPPDSANRYTVFIHSGGWKQGDSDEKVVTPVVSALAQRGYVVRPPDNQRDEAGGAGVDYFAESDDKIAQDIANVVNDVLYKSEPKVKPRYQRIRNPTGYIGVWLYSEH
jgi:hypothetical protein